MTFVKDRPGHDRRYAIDASRLKRDLGWEPAYTFESGISETIDWYLANGEWVADVTSGAYRDYYESQYGGRTMILVVGANGMLGHDMMACIGDAARGVDIDEIDITSLESTERVLTTLKPQTVINCAAYTDVDGCEIQYRNRHAGQRRRGRPSRHGQPGDRGPPGACQHRLRL